MEDQNKDQASYWAEKSSLENLLQENIKHSRLILEDTQKIKRYMMIRVVFNIIWLVLVLAPVIAAIFWLPDVIQDFIYLGGESQGVSDLLNQLNQLK
jgi:hypothetical protein